MSTLELLLYSVSVTLVFTRGTLFMPLRGLMRDASGNWYRAPAAESVLVRSYRDWAGCPLCAGTWIGVAFVLSSRGVSGHWTLFRAMSVLGFGCATGAVAAFVDSLTDFFDEAFRAGGDG